MINFIHKNKDSSALLHPGLIIQEMVLRYSKDEVLDYFNEIIIGFASSKYAKDLPNGDRINILQFLMDIITVAENFDYKAFLEYPGPEMNPKTELTI
jgi:hypothetical protein